MDGEVWHSLFLQLTPKQHEVLRHIAENRTSKEIAWELGISESAVNQRIEGVRSRAGAPPRAQLSRAYRQYLQAQEAACNPLPVNNLQVTETPGSSDVAQRDDTANSPASANPSAVSVDGTRQSDRFDSIVPEVLDGPNAGVNRIVAMIAIAASMFLLVLLGLEVVRKLTEPV